MRSIILLILPLLTSCASTNREWIYKKDVQNQEDLDKIKYDCAKDVRLVIPHERNDKIKSSKNEKEYNRLFALCMNAHGYYFVSEE